MEKVGGLSRSPRSGPIPAYRLGTGQERLRARISGRGGNEQREGERELVGRVQYTLKKKKTGGCMLPSRDRETGAALVLEYSRPSWLYSSTATGNKARLATVEPAIPRRKQGASQSVSSQVKSQNTDR